MVVGANIRRLRRAAGISSNRLAELSGLSNVRMIELGYRRPSMGSLDRIAEALGVKVGDLFTEPPKRARKAI